MKGLWLLPTRRRLGKLQNFFDAAMMNGISTPGVCLVKKEELSELKDQYDGIRKPYNWSILETNSEGLADKCREIWSAISKLDWVGLACDDLVPKTPLWDRKLIDAVTGKNIVTCDDGEQGNLRMAGITVFSGNVLRAMGYMFPPHFWHTYADNVWEDIGRDANCWTYVESVLIRHDHPFRGQKIDPSLSDDTTVRSYGQAVRDQQAYATWIATDKESCVKRVTAL